MIILVLRGASTPFLGFQNISNLLTLSFFCVLFSIPYQNAYILKRSPRLSPYLSRSSRLRLFVRHILQTRPSLNLRASAELLLRTLPSGNTTSRNSNINSNINGDSG